MEAHHCHYQWWDLLPKFPQIPVRVLAQLCYVISQRQIFADDAKLYAVVNTANDPSIVQQDLTRVV